MYQPGERVHSFTSPLGTLLLTLGALGGDSDPAQRALWGFRVLSAAALLVRGTRHAGLSAAAYATACGYLQFDAVYQVFRLGGVDRRPP
ncbi:MAG: hypothetical protein ACOZE5_18410 [Verrucomicrobiota bacterium]